MIIVIPEQAIDSNITRLTNQLWKLIPMRENNENWLEHLDSLYVELAGLSEIVDNANEKLLVLLSKIKGLRV